VFRRRPQRPDARRIVARAIALQVLSTLARADGTEAARELLRDPRVHEELEPSEQRLVDLEPASWSSDERDEYVTDEAAGTLFWAIGAVAEIPPYDSPIEFGVGSDASGGRRPDEELDRARDLAELWHWRVRTRLLAEGGRPGAEASTTDPIVAQVAAEAHRRGDLDTPVDDDFPAFGRAFRNLDEKEFVLVAMVAHERHRALNWLCGYAPLWSDAAQTRRRA
jgi:hypothetical protein